MCNYAHRQQDFRRPPQLYYYEPVRCPYISDDGSWENCDYYLDCPYSHTLMEILFNPLNYKLNDCFYKTSTDKYKCTQVGELCCHAHSNDVGFGSLRSTPSSRVLDCFGSYSDLSQNLPNQSGSLICAMANPDRCRLNQSLSLSLD